MRLTRFMPSAESWLPTRDHVDDPFYWRIRACYTNGVLHMELHKAWMGTSRNTTIRVE